MALWDQNLGLSSGLQLVFVVPETFVIKANVFGERADLLQPHFLTERALDAEALMHNFPLQETEATRRAFNRTGFQNLSTTEEMYLLEMKVVEGYFWGSWLKSPLQ